MARPTSIQIQVIGIGHIAHSRPLSACPPLSHSVRRLVSKRNHSSRLQLNLSPDNTYLSLSLPDTQVMQVI